MGEKRREGMDGSESNGSAADRKRKRKTRRGTESEGTMANELRSSLLDHGFGESGRGSSRALERSRSMRKTSTRLSSRRQAANADDELSEPSFHQVGANEAEADRRKQLNETGKVENSSSSLLERLSATAESPETPPDKRAHAIRRFRLWCGKIVEDPRVQLGIIILIIINAILMGIATFDFVTDDPRTDDAFDKVDRVFLVIFTLEMLLQLVYRSISFFTDPWLLFDFAIVITSWSMESLQIVRAFRIFRAFRLVTRIGSLRELVMAIGAVMPRMYAIAMLLLLIFYIFAVLFTELFSELELSGNYFGSLDVSLFTCMQLMTLEWAETTREVMEQKKWAWAPLMAFISVTGFIVFNLIVAVVCDAVAVVDREVQAEKHPELLSDKEKLEEARERIWELTETVEILMMRQERLLGVVDLLSKEVRSSVLNSGAVVANHHAEPRRSAMKNSTRENDLPRPHIIDASNMSNEKGEDYHEDVGTAGTVSLSERSTKAATDQGSHSDGDSLTAPGAHYIPKRFPRENSPGPVTFLKSEKLEI